jgi:hypothetical protein
LELLLNLCWLLLILLAFCFWLGQPRSRSLQATLALSCLLSLLFPIISATDDLNAMRQVSEESGPGKRMLKRTVNHSFAAGGSNTPAAELHSIFQGLPCNQTCGCILIAPPGVPLTACTTISPGRAPPFSVLA